jgi:hypothetical protein
MCINARNTDCANSLYDNTCVTIDDYCFSSSTCSNQCGNIGKSCIYSPSSPKCLATSYSYTCGTAAPSTTPALKSSKLVVWNFFEAGEGKVCLCLVGCFAGKGHTSSD